MNPDLQQMKKDIADLKRRFQSLENASTIPLSVDQALRKRLAELNNLPDGFEDAPLTAITAPTGGLTVDGPARTAINAIITTLELLGLINEN